MRDEQTRARLRAACIFIAILATERAASFIVEGMADSHAMLQVLAVVKALAAGLAGGLAFMAVRAEWRQGGQLWRRAHAAHALILAIVIVALACSLHPLLEGADTWMTGVDPGFLNGLALAVVGAIVSLMLDRVDAAVARVRMGRDEEAGRAARNVMLQGVMILGLVLSLGAVARDTHHHMQSDDAAVASATTNALLRLKGVVENAGRTAFPAYGSQDDGVFTRAFNVAAAHQSNARWHVVAFRARNLGRVTELDAMSPLKTFDGAWLRVRDAALGVQRSTGAQRVERAVALGDAIDEFKPVIERTQRVIDAVEAARQADGSNFILDVVTGTLGVVVAALLLIPLFRVSGAQMERVGRALAQSQRLNDNLASYQRALDQYAIFSVTDAAGRILHVNDQFLKVSGFSPREVIGQSHRLLNSGTHGAVFFEEMWQALEKRGFWRGEICNRAADGALYWIDACITSLTGDDGRVDRYVAIAHDISERKQVEMGLQRRLRVERSLAALRSEAMVQGAIYSSLPQLLEVLNEVTGSASSLVVELGSSRDRSTWGLMLGYSRKESLSGEIDAGTLPRLVNLEGLHGLLLDAFKQNELFGGLTARQLGATSFTAIPLGNGLDPLGALLVAGEFDADAFREEIGLVVGGLGELLAMRRDADRRRTSEESTVRLAKRDPLTGLGNRRDLLEEFEARTDHPDAKFALLLVDLDRFKPINDTFGHTVGDAVLRVVSDRLQATVRGDYTVARMGGDEFAILTEAHASVDEEGALDLAYRIIEELSQPIKCDGHLLSVGASVGIALYPRDGSSFQEVLHCADAAMYRAKANRAGAKVFDALADEGMRHRAELETELKTAMDDGSVVPFFQPFVDLETGKVAGHEVLARWNHPVRGSVPPAEFVKIAEDAGMVEKLFWLMLRAACSKHVAGGFDTILSLNLVPAQIENPGFAKQLIEELETIGFPPHLLEVEITETTSIGDLDRARPMLMLLKACGIQIALDDFGVGYSSLALLRNLPISKLKIDRSFTSDLESSDPGRATLVNAILGIASAMYLKVTAEGIENAAVADYLRAHGAHYGQGYLYGKPSVDIVVELAGSPKNEPQRLRA